MPAPKRMVKGGGDLPSNPAQLRKQRSGAAEAPEGPAQLELVPEPPAAPEVAPQPAQSAGIVLTIKSSTLKESKGKSRAGKPPVYRSVTGKDAGGTTFWMAIELDQAEPQKGEQWVVDGTRRKPFGKDKNPLHPIEVTSFKRYEEVAEEIATVPSASADSLVQTMAALVREHGNYTVLKALAEAIK